MKIVIVEQLSEIQELALGAMQKITFPDVDDDEAREDFFHPKSAHVLALEGEEVVGWAGIHEKNIEYEGRKIRLGGYGIGTHPDWRRKGIANKLAESALQYLAGRGCDIAFLSVELPNAASIKLHQKNGFVHLPVQFSWRDVHGTLKEDRGGMIAALNSKPLFELVLNGQSVFHVGDGYW